MNIIIRKNRIEERAGKSVDMKGLESSCIYGWRKTNGVFNLTKEKKQ